MKRLAPSSDVLPESGNAGGAPTAADRNWSRHLGACSTLLIVALIVYFAMVPEIADRAVAMILACLTSLTMAPIILKSPASHQSARPHLRH
ncbi:hypothetical protein QUC32_29115 (plasmid) [Novosphingobium resinovorum]|uniref:hypothetical protein n=1 Tax=Novosphingobium TaxID=165696 RepID=UPI001B3C710D|nr:MULTISPECIES: hypothetical protein [Novosphingobium]MBF7015041.1 hypothetical protein [Novosphingobium sp. HR1a]WJM29725.1 hypothetical protein QUC32_29115 [Novosphingobium resinovorum]